MTDLLDTLAATRQRFLELVADVRPELHRYCTRMTGSVFDGEDVVQDTLAKASYALAGMQAAPPLRTAAAMSTSVAAVKAALVRARANVAKPRAAEGARADDLERLRRYAALFNARDWDALRALFGAETQLEVVTRVHRRGPAAAEYFTRYADVATVEDLRLEAGRVGGVAVIAIYRPAASAQPAYFIQLDWRDEHVERVRDYRYVPYIAEEARFTRDPAPAPPPRPLR